MDQIQEAIIDVQPGDAPRIAGTRLTIYDIMDYLQLGWHQASIAAWFRISSEQVKAAIRFIEEHREESERIHREIVARHLRGNSPEVIAKMAASKAKWGPVFDEHARRREQESHAPNPG
jgi:uncharacterized protein (DUF433 family)